MAVVAGAAFFLIPMVSGYTITRYLSPMQWWTPCLAGISIALVLGTHTLTDFLQTGEFLGEFPVLEVTYQLCIAGSFLVGGYIQFARFAGRTTPKHRDNVLNKK